MLLLGTQQEAGTACVPQAQQVVANTAWQTLWKFLHHLAWGQGSAELQDQGLGGDSKA